MRNALGNRSRSSERGNQAGRAARPGSAGCPTTASSGARAHAFETYADDKFLMAGLAINLKVELVDAALACFDPPEDLPLAAH